MGCANSKLDDSPAVALCRDRCAVLDEAIRQRYAFAEAHVAYLHSLKSVGLSLDRFFSQDLGGSASGPLSPVLNLPTQRKGDPRPPPQTSGSPAAKIEHHLDSSSDSGSHLHFHSDGSDDEDGSGTESLHLHHEVGSPIHHQPLTTPQLPYGTYFSGYENVDMNLTAAGGRFMNINYMKNQTTPSVIYTQRPMNLETMHIRESSAPYAYPNNQSSNPPYHVYNLNNNYGGYPNYPPYGAGDGFWGGSSSAPAPPYGGGFSSSSALASTSKAPPPPPAPMNPSAWDFFNPFESFDKFYPPYTPSRNSREVREEEGIPDLENGDDEVVKEIHGNQKFVDSGRSSHSKPDVSDKDAREVKKAELHHRAKPSVGNESDPPMEYEVHMVDKKVDAEKPKEQGNTSGFKRHGGFNGDSDVVRQIQVQFERASESGSELAKFLEAGKLPYKRKHGGRQVSSKILHLPLVSSQPSTSKSSDSANSDALDINQDLELRSKNLSSTLHKLYLWEKKLHEEVKAEEKMRLLHERKSRKLKRLDEKGAEAHKVDATRALVKSLSTKIRIAIQVVDKISVKINTLRDEELWPQLNEFIQVLTRMWKSMLESHRIQRQAMAEAERLDAVALRRSHSNDTHVVATKQLEHELVNWTLRFSFWVGAQRGFVRALHTWLMKCLLYEPEETADGVAPFSPSRVGAPAIFVVCNQWWQSLERVSEEEVMGSMRAVALSVLEQWDRGKAEMRREMVGGGDEGRMKKLEKEDAVIQKGIQALERRMEVLLSSGEYGGGQAVYQSETSRGGSLQGRLQQLLQAMERFCASLVKVYEDLTQRVEEEDDGAKETVS